MTIISELEEALLGVKAVFCDIWGVLHNGVSAFPAACGALVRAREAGLSVILLSNAPRPGIIVQDQLDRLGVPRAAYDDIVTSGDVCRDMIAARRPTPFYHLGPDRDRPLFEGLGIEPVEPASAGYLLCTGLLDDTRETPEDYRARLTAFAAQGLPMLCANPDLVIDRGGKEVFCAGALAALYQSLGGKAQTIGKPYGDAYAYALRSAIVVGKADLAPSDVLAIGDSFRTDIAGANAYGAMSLFVAAGIHAPDFIGASGAIDPVKAKHALQNEAARPDYLMPRLA